MTDPADNIEFMIVHRCDKCGKIIKDPKTTVHAGIGYENLEFCADCGMPIAQILKRYNIKK